MKKIALSAIIVFILCCAGPASATVIFSDTFDNENNGTYFYPYDQFINWTVTDGSVDLIGNGMFDIQPGNGLYVDLDGSTRDAGKLTTTLYLEEGDYILQFELAGNQLFPDTTEQVNVLVDNGNLFSKSYSLAYDESFTLFTEYFSVEQSGSYTLSFEGMYGDNSGMLLDDVQVLTAVPIPAAIYLFGFGLLGILGYRKNA